MSTRAKTRVKKRKHEWSCGKVFLAAGLIAACIFIPAMIIDDGYFIFLGDFNSQQIPFYQLAHKAIKSGEWGWNWYTDLGVNFIGSYSFYLLGSPFFWLTIPFPNWFVPYLMGPLLILKFACCATTSFMWLRRHVRCRDFAALGGLLYAFSGFSIYNIFFNHFHEPMIFFPLLLIGIDELMDHGTHGVFALSVMVNAIVSYFFFVGEVVFVVIYFFVRVFTHGYAFTWKRFGQLILEAVLGFLMSMFLFWPSLLVMLSNSRVNNFPDGYDIWIYSNEFRIFAILQAFFMPNELPSKQIMITEASVRWTSLSAYLPLFSVAGSICFVRTHKGHWLRTLLIILLVMALIPGLNALFTAFNKTYYARWFYMFVLMLDLATLRVLDEQKEEELEKTTIHVLAFTVAYVLILALTPEVSSDGSIELGIYDKDNTWQFVFICCTAMLSLSALLLFLGSLKTNKRLFAFKCILAVAVISIVYGNFYITWGKSRAYDSDTYFIPDVLEGSFETDYTGFFRIDSDDSCVNIGMFWEVADIHAFHSLVPASITEFYEFIGEERGVKSEPDYDNYQIRSLLSVKYFVDSHDEGDDFIVTKQVDGETIYETQMPGYVLIGEQNDYDIYENQYFIPMGFTYSSWCTETEAMDLDESNRGQLMLQTLIIPDDYDFTKLSSITHEYDTLSLDLSEEYYIELCQERAENTVTSFEYDSSGFTASIYSDEDTLLFFSVPYEEGWSAEVNGEEAEIIKANVGFMAVMIEEGSSNVVFSYETPGLKSGAFVSLLALITFIGYLVIVKILNDRKEKRKTRLAEERARQLERSETDHFEWMLDDQLDHTEHEESKHV